MIEDAYLSYVQKRRREQRREEIGMCIRVLLKAALFAGCLILMIEAQGWIGIQ